MEELGFSSILGEEDVERLGLFSSPEENDQEPEALDTEPDEQGEKKTKKTKTTEVNPDELFEQDEPESVGSEETVKDEEGTDTDSAGASPNDNDFYSSIANACAVDGAFQHLDDNDLKNVKTAEDFFELIEKETNARFDEKQQRLIKALENGVEAADIRRYENTLSYIDSIQQRDLVEESEKGEALRRNIIFQDFLNKGYSQERAKKLTERTIEAGTDIEDAKDALESNRDYFQKEYDKLVNEAQAEADRQKEERRKQADKLKNDILKDKYLFGDIEITQAIRNKVIDNIAKPMYRDPETGDMYTALQKYEMENRADFIKYIGTIFTLTNGFKDFDTFVKGKVAKEKKKGLRELERTLTNTKKNSGGNLKLVTNSKVDPESMIGKGWDLDV